MAIKVFNADDHPILRKGITDLLVESEGLAWAGSAENGKEALEKIRETEPDVAVLDIEMPYLTGLEVAKQLLSTGIRTQFILLTLYKDETFLNNAINAGIKGYLLKESSEKEILDCIRAVNRGQAYVSAKLTQFLLQREPSENTILAKLTEHEINILKLIGRQKSTAEIAGMLFISPKTVSNHRTNISRKLELGGEQNGLLKWAIANKHLLD